jgi:hypothetical protein
MSKALSTRKFIAGAVAASAVGAAVLGGVAIAHDPGSSATALTAAQVSNSDVHGYRLTIKDNANSGDNGTLIGKYDASGHYGELNGQYVQIAYTPRGEYIKSPASGGQWQYKGALPTDPGTALALDPGHALTRLKQLAPNAKQTSHNPGSTQYTGVYEGSDGQQQVINHVQLTLGRNGLPTTISDHETKPNGSFVQNITSSLSDYGTTVQPPNIH